MRHASRCAIIAATLVLLLASGASAQTGDKSPPGAAVPKPAAGAPAKAPAAKLAGTFGQWSLVCPEAEAKNGTPPCSLVQALVEKDSQKLVFRVTVIYGPKGNLVLKIDAPTGVALQRGLEFSPDAVKTYRMPFQTCLPRGCSAVLLVEDDLKHDLQKSAKGTITVYALDGQAVRAATELTGFSDGLAALDKRRAKP